MAKLTIPDFQKDIAKLAGRVAWLERRIRVGAGGADTTRDILFSYAGALTITESPPVRVRRGGRLGGFAVTLGTAGSTSTVLTIKQNGTAIATLTIPAGTAAYDIGLNNPFVANVDTLTVAITTVGLGAADMTAEARFT
jgi:hypothetical protein